MLFNIFHYIVKSVKEIKLVHLILLTAFEGLALNMDHLFTCTVHSGSLCTKSLKRCSVHLVRDF